jgi:hypothetical protein
VHLHTNVNKNTTTQDIGQGSNPIHIKWNAAKQSECLSTKNQSCRISKNFTNFINDSVYNFFRLIAFTLFIKKAVSLLKIDCFSNGQNCSILSQKVPKFELYKHNDELFNIYYGIFYEL